MKKSTKTLLISLCAVLLVAASVMGTLAYLTSTATVTNTFSIGSVSITMDETNVDVYGVALTGEQAGRGNANTYKLVPGHTYTKDPTVHVDAASEPCYVFVTVANNVSSVEATGTGTIAAQMATNGWTETSTGSGVYYYNLSTDSKVTNAGVYTATTGSNDIPVFATFTVDGNADLTNMANQTIVVTAYAIQSDGFDTAAAAWAASGWGSTTTE